MKNYLEIDGRTYYAFEEADFIGPRLSQGLEGKAGWPGVAPDWNGLEKGPEPRIYDWAFGVILPVLCFAADPGVFGSHYLYREGVLGGMAVFAYALSFAAVMGTMAWLIWGNKLGAALPFLSGVLATSALVSLLLGILLFPASFIGIVYLVGFLGFTPLFTSRVFFRTSKAAFQASASYCDRVTAWHLFGLGALASFVLPFLANIYW
jgi:hypothetical protein